MSTLVYNAVPSNNIMSVKYRSEVLIVDDDPANIDLLYGILKEQQYHVRVATNGRMALANVRSAHPDLILLDINMPQMNGYEVCEQLKADPNSKDVPVIFISASDETIDKVRAFAVGGVDYVTKPFQTAEVVARIESQLKIARLSHELQMQMLRYQLDPHFLFNALNSILTLIFVNSEVAASMIVQLASYLRYLLTSRNNLEIPVAEEVGAAQDYLAIEKIRFDGNLIVEIDIDSEIGHYLMPAFLLQPLLENAIKYGQKTNSLPLSLSLSIKRCHDALCFRVSNTGYWVNETENDLPTTASLGVGLQNIRKRLKQRYPGRHNFAISERDGWVNVEIEIPIEVTR
jgi:DNA-binding response OmpR family regulator